MHTSIDSRPDELRRPLDIGGSLICGAVFVTAQPCAYGSTEHQCWNSETCQGIHVCCCEAVPDYVTNYLDNHEETTYDDAVIDLTIEENGAAVCRCCGVNQNDAVDQD